MIRFSLFFFLSCLHLVWSAEPICSPAWPPVCFDEQSSGDNYLGLFDHCQRNVHIVGVTTHPLSDVGHILCRCVTSQDIIMLWESSMGGLHCQPLLHKLCSTDGWLRLAWDTAKTLSWLKINTISRPASLHRPTGISLGLYSVGEGREGRRASETWCDIGRCARWRGETAAICFK